MASKKVNKSAWIRSQPIDTPAADLVAAAKKEGISISVGQVYTARSELRKKGGTVGKPGRRPGSTVARVSTASGGSIDEMIRAIVRDEVKRYFTER